MIVQERHRRVLHGAASAAIGLLTWSPETLVLTIEKRAAQFTAIDTAELGHISFDWVDGSYLYL